jgi:ketosteroid isomerase-like protein
MELRKLKKVMRTYGQAWEKQDTALLLTCFTVDGVYQESPLAKPYRGHAQIKRFWDRIVVHNTKDVTFSLKKCYVSGSVGFAEWECLTTHKWDDGRWRKGRMVGIMVVRMRGDKISHLNEYWNTKILR